MPNLEKYQDRGISGQIQDFYEINISPKVTELELGNKIAHTFHYNDKNIKVRYTRDIKSLGPDLSEHLVSFVLEEPLKSGQERYDSRVLFTLYYSGNPKELKEIKNSSFIISPGVGESNDFETKLAKALKNLKVKTVSLNQ